LIIVTQVKTSAIAGVITPRLVELDAKNGFRKHVGLDVEEDATACARAPLLIIVQG
jgi:hypothetical protein